MEEEVEEIKIVTNKSQRSNESSFITQTPGSAGRPKANETERRGNMQERPLDLHGILSTQLRPLRNPYINTTHLEPAFNMTSTETERARKSNVEGNENEKASKKRGRVGVGGGGREGMRAGGGAAIPSGGEAARHPPNSLYLPS
ncbi:hypothetical protein E2C01_035117 [Portunus trituberculatus]|uniref:Uncharacterized protein n=1 Tax=Portunus trituberculatus TaxID=210409 RepID=A0A5B7F3B5_PORTR|nr:hypothetical protein [Portunus trituberculatus]